MDSSAIDTGDNFKVKPSEAIVPIHSPKHLLKRDTKFSLRSPLGKRDARVQIDGSNRDRLNKVHSLDGTHV